MIDDTSNWCILCEESADLTTFRHTVESINDITAFDGTVAESWCLLCYRRVGRHLMDQWYTAHMLDND